MGKFLGVHFTLKSPALCNDNDDMSKPVSQQKLEN